MCLPWATQHSFLPIAPSGWFYTANPLVTRLWWCPLTEQGSLKARLLNKLPSSLSNSPLYIYAWANTAVFTSSTEQQGSSDRAFLKA